jgi:lysophospholipase L1-like esterase
MYETFVALGDSFTEGLDDVRPDGTYRGWADLVAAELASRTPGFRYANLAVRGRRLRRIREEQVPLAEAMAPSLVGIAAGGNDLIGFRCDVPALARSMHELLERLANTGATVVVFTGFDPRGRLPMSRVLTSRARFYNASLQASARQLGARVVDLWTMPHLSEPQMWARDRLHLSPAGHALVASSVLETLGLDSRLVAQGSWQPGMAASWLAARRSDVEWVGTYFAPWVSRQLRGRSAGDFIDPKLPELTTYPTWSAEPRVQGGYSTAQ